MTDEQARASITQAAHEAVKKLDPNMLAILAMVIVLNGLFFWALRVVADNNHVEFTSVLNLCQRYSSNMGLDR